VKEEGVGVQYGHGGFEVHVKCLSGVVEQARLLDMCSPAQKRDLILKQ
jgi:hypothetical protein